MHPHHLRSNGLRTHIYILTTRNPPPPAKQTQEEEGTEYLQFSCPLTEMYAVMFDVPSALLVWRVPLRKGKDGGIVLQEGQIISEKNSL